MIFREMCEKMTLRIEDFEILVANNSKYFCGTIINPIWGGAEMYLDLVDRGEWKMDDDGYYHNPATDELRMIMSQKDYDEFDSVEISCNGATILLKRYGQTCLDKATVYSDPRRKADLIQMGENLIWISENPARTFWQACQAALLYEMMIGMAGVNDIGSFGRFGQYTLPFLKKDLEEGRVTMDQA
jgi:pyruvate-formate lyase